MRVLIFSLLFVLSIDCNAVHIIGGTISYEVMSVNDGNTTLAVSMRIYRDANSTGAQFDPFASVGIFGLISGSDYQHIRTLSPPVTSTETLDFGNDQECTFPEIIVELGVYDFEVTVPTEAYSEITIAYQRCCRGPQTVNLAFPEETGLALSTDITARGLSEVGAVSSFSDFYPLRSQPNEPKQYDLSIDGDTDIKYEQVPALVAGGDDGVVFGDPISCTGITPDPLMCPPPFEFATYIDSDTSPFGFSGPVELDEDTGMLELDLSQIGQYVMAVKATHSIGGEVVSRMYQQFSHTVAPCVLDVQDNDQVDVVSYPSPVGEQVFMNTSATSLEFYDAIGRVNMVIPNYRADDPIDVSSLDAGVYFARGLSSEGLNIAFKFIVAR